MLKHYAVTVGAAAGQSLDHGMDFVKHQTTDAFLDGRLRVIQPQAGFRAGLESVLLGASVSALARNLLDLGCGVGVAAMVALTHNPDLRAHLVDRDEEAIAMASANLAANRLSGRAEAVRCDIMASAAERQQAGLGASSCDAIVANPPFFTRGRGTPSRETSRDGARHMPSESLEAWVKVAVGSASARGEVIFIHEAAALPQLLGAFEGRFGEIAVLPIVPRPGAAATRVLVRGIKGSRAAMRLLSPIVLHGQTGNGFQPDIAAVLRGERRLIW